MELIKSTLYSDFYFDKKTSYFLVIRKKKTGKMTSEDYKKDCLLWAKLLIKYKPEKQLVNDVNMEFIITPELQKWANINLITPGIKAGLKKVAFLESFDTFSKTSIKQTMDDNSLPIQISYFDNFDRAKKWLGFNF